jgi:hypothetical protein
MEANHPELLDTEFVELGEEELLTENVFSIGYARKSALRPHSCQVRERS